MIPVAEKQKKAPMWLKTERLAVRVEEVAENLDVQYTLVAFAFTIGALLGSIVIFFIGRPIDRLGPRWSARSVLHCAILERRSEKERIS